MAVPIQISLPSGEVVEVVEEQNQLALIQSDFEVSSVAQMERDVVVVEDWASDTLSEEAGLLNEECFSPLAVEPLAFSLPLSLEGQVAVGVESTTRNELHSEWFQSRFNRFDDFLGTSLQGLEK